MYLPLLKSHSGLRWVFLLLFVLALVYLFRLAFQGKNDRKATIFARLSLIVAHLQLVLGLILYFISPKVIFQAASMKDAVTRFFLVEHISLMLIAIVIMTISFSRNKGLLHDRSKATKLFYSYLIAFVLIMISIPWPFRNLGAGWF
jgi:hypothetical protein